MCADHVGCFQYELNELVHLDLYDYRCVNTSTLNGFQVDIGNDIPVYVPCVPTREVRATCICIFACVLNCSYTLPICRFSKASKRETPDLIPMHEL